MTVKTKFKSSKSEKRWVELQQEKTELQNKKLTQALQEKLYVLSSLMTSCKVGFNLPEAKVKKIIKFLKDKTGNYKIKYGTLPEDVRSESTLFKDIIIIYAEKDGQLFFREHYSE